LTQARVRSAGRTEGIRIHPIELTALLISLPMSSSSSASSQSEVCDAGGHWTLANVPIGCLEGQIVAITGANSGIGFETAKALTLTARAHVVMCGRSAEKLKAAKEQILEHKKKDDSSTLEARLDTMVVDVSSTKSVQAFATNFTNTYDRLDILINNAGVMFFPEHKISEDGLDAFMATNHLGPFLLTKLLFPLIKKTADAKLKLAAEKVERAGDCRIIHVASGAHWQSNGIDFSAKAWTPHSEEAVKGPINKYEESKLANLLMTRELADRLDKSAKLSGAGSANILSVACHPGAASTNLAENACWLTKRVVGRVAMPQSQGALSEIRAAVDEKVKSGDYYGPHCWFGGLSGYPVETRGMHLTYSKVAQDKEMAEKLWGESEKILGIKFEV